MGNVSLNVRVPIVKIPTYQVPTYQRQPAG